LRVDGAAVERRDHARPRPGLLPERRRGRDRRRAREALAPAHTGCREGGGALAGVPAVPPRLSAAEGRSGGDAPALGELPRLRDRASPISAAASRRAEAGEEAAVAAAPGRELAALLGDEAVLDGADPVYSRDATETRGIEGHADAVVFPASAEEVARVLAW